MTDPRTRLNDLPTSVNMSIRSAKAGMWTALPAIVKSFNAAKMTCEVQPAIQGVLSDPKTGAASNTNLPLLVDCPVIFPSGGGMTMTFPIASGDECLVIFASRCIDAWWQNGGIQPPMVYRMHDLSDGFVMVGPRSQKRLIGGISATDTEIRTDDGAVKFALGPSGINVTGTMNVTGDIILNGKSLKDHKHIEVKTGTDISGKMQ